MFSKLLPLLTVAVTVNAAAHAATADDEMIADLANLALSCVAFQASDEGASRVRALRDAHASSNPCDELAETVGVISRQCRRSRRFSKEVFSSKEMFYSGSSRGSASGVSTGMSGSYVHGVSGSGSHHGDDDDTLECMTVSCSSEYEACGAASACLVELTAVMSSDNGPESARGKSAEYGTLLQCMVDECSLEMASENVCQQIGDIVRNKALTEVLEAAGIDVEDLTNAIKDPNDTSGAVSTTAQLAAVAAATAVALVW